MNASRPGSILAIAIAASLIGACGGGGSSPMVRTEAPAPAQVPPPRAAAICLPPIGADCIVTDIHDASGQSLGNLYMSGGRTSNYALVTRVVAGLRMERGVYRFAGGTRVEKGSLSIAESTTLVANTTVLPEGSLFIAGNLTGSVTNTGAIGLAGTILGDVTNHATLGPDSNVVRVAPGKIEGNLRQSADGTLVAAIGSKGGSISVTGRADIDGTLRLIQATDNSFGAPVPTPAAPFSIVVLHADGGVFGQFAKWTSSGLFITGAIRYLANDVYFDASAISAAAAMAAARADRLTVASAARFDTALGSASRSSGTDELRTPEQQRFLVAAGLIQRTQAFDQAIRTFDSLSGQGYATANNALLQQASMPSTDLMARMDRINAGAKLGAWSGQSATLASINGIFNGVRAGFDQWLGGSTVLGASLGSSDGSLRFERAGGTTRDRAPQWDVYAQHLFTDSTYLFGDVGYSLHRLDGSRSLDLGVGQFAVRGSRDLRLLRTYLEAGEHFRMGNGRLTAFAGLGHATLRGTGFVEQGVTGFELAARPSLQQRTSALAGVRFGEVWRSGDRVTTLSLGAGYAHIIQANGDLRAAFTGAPDVVFPLDALPAPRGSAWMQLGLATGSEHWQIGLNYDRQARNDSVMLHTRVAF